MLVIHPEQSRAWWKRFFCSDKTNFRKYIYYFSSILVFTLLIPIIDTDKTTRNMDTQITVMYVHSGHIRDKICKNVKTDLTYIGFDNFSVQQGVHHIHSFIHSFICALTTQSSDIYHICWFQIELCNFCNSKWAHASWIISYFLFFFFWWKELVEWPPVVDFFIHFGSACNGHAYSGWFSINM